MEKAHEKQLNDKEYKEIILSALFHDIGKFSQRTRNNKYKTDRENILCPYNREYNRFTHQHVLYTDGFFEYCRDTFENILPEKLSLQNIQDHACRHHDRQQDSLDYIVSVADHISSGADRSKKEIESESTVKFYRQPLLSIFCKVSLKGEVEYGYNYKKFFYNLKPLRPQNSFPDESVTIDENQYENLWNCFVADFYKLSEKKYNYNSLLRSIDSLFEQYLWCIPSSTIDEPDVSLYDHLITTAAFASVLYQYHSLTNSLHDENSIKNISAKKFLFILGDLSGIQNYIFNLKNTAKNAKLLRARSFELQLITDSVAQLILDNFYLPHFCNLMNAGGRFLLVLPNVDGVNDVLIKIKYRIEEYFIKKYFGELSLNISDGVDASAIDLNRENFRYLYEEISASAREAKLKKFQVYLVKNSPVIEHEYNQIKGNENICDYCEKRAKPENRDACYICDKLIRIGAKIPKSEFLLFIKDKKDSLDIKLLPDNSDFELLISDKVKDIPENVTLAVKLKGFEPGYPVIHIPYYLPRYTKPIKDDYGNIVESKNEGDIKLFEDIEKEAEGYNKLAMLKADVDYLGLIFYEGLHKYLSISRYTTLSRMLNYFFSKVLNYEIEKNYKDIYVIFSGGDDLCIIGPWDKIIDFTISVREKFKAFTCFNEYINISAGITLFKHNLPVKFVTEKAEEELDKSKRYEDKEKMNFKNKITIFGTTMEWKDFKEAIRIGNELASMIKNNRISKGLAYRLLRYYFAYKKAIKGDINPVNMLWCSHFAYDVARNVREKKDREWIKKIVYENIENLKVIATYALYKNR